MRFPKYKTKAAQGRGESTAEPRQQQQSYLQRVRSHLASFRVPYQSKINTKNSKRSKKQNAHEEAGATTVASCKQDELRSADQDIVYHLGSSDSEYYTVSQHLRHEESRHDAAADQDALNSSSKNQSSRSYLLSWGETKTRIQQTTTMIRDVCMTTSSALLSSAWRVYPRNNNKDVASPSSSSSSGADTPPPKRRMKEKEQYEQWLMTTAGRESEISICMSYYSSRSLSDAATDNEDQSQVNKMRSSSCRNSSSSFRGSNNPKAREADPFRRRGSSTDSYKTIYNERLSSGRNEDSRRSYDKEEREDFDDEIIRDSLFLLHGKPYTVKNEWI